MRTRLSTYSMNDNSDSKVTGYRLADQGLNPVRGLI